MLQQAAGLADLSQVAHSFFLVAQDANRSEQEARVTVRIRIIVSSWLVPSAMKPGHVAVSLLAHLHWGRSRRRWWWLGSAGDKAAGDDRCREGEEGVFHSVVFVVFVIALIDTVIVPENY